jgi:hypothetical protein
MKTGNSEQQLTNGSPIRQLSFLRVLLKESGVFLWGTT